VRPSSIAAAGLGLFAIATDSTDSAFDHFHNFCESIASPTEAAVTPTSESRIIFNNGDLIYYMEGEVLSWKQYEERYGSRFDPTDQYWFTVCAFLCFQSFSQRSVQVILCFLKLLSLTLLGCLMDASLTRFHVVGSWRALTIRVITVESMLRRCILIDDRRAYQCLPIGPFEQVSSDHRVFTLSNRVLILFSHSFQAMSCLFRMGNRGGRHFHQSRAGNVLLTPRLR
jgi:hypothetical protein